jgi:hypothetical protein
VPFSEGEVADGGEEEEKVSMATTKGRSVSGKLKHGDVVGDEGPEPPPVCVCV